VQTDRLPEFPGGEKKLFKFMSTYLEYPMDARNNKVQGTVIVKFVVTEIGKLDSIEVYRGVRPDLNKAAIDLVKQMPNWIPGIENGKPTRVRFSLPITFRCQ
jgi:protein TonB